MKIAVMIEAHLGGLTQFTRFACLVSVEPAESKRYLQRRTRGTGVFDNLFEIARNSLILKRRDVRVVEGARLEHAAGERHQTTPNRARIYAIRGLGFQNYHSACVRTPRCSSRFRARRITVLSQSRSSLTACCWARLSTRAAASVVDQEIDSANSTPQRVQPWD